MIFRKFRLNIIVRSLILFLLFGGLLYSLYQHEWYTTSSVIVLFIVLAFFELIRYVEKTNRQFADFLNSIKSRDFAGGHGGRVSGKGFDELNEAFAEITHAFNNIKIEKEIHYQYLQLLLNHIEIGILCFNEKGEITFINQSMNRYFNKTLKTIDDLKSIDKGLFQLVVNMEPSESSLCRYNKGDEVMQLSISLSLFKIEDQLFRLVSFKNIREELDSKELDAWQKLIRVISHEIMNSATPIVSMSEAIKDILFDEKSNAIPLHTIEGEDAKELFTGIRAIERKSKSMLDFIGAYKDLTRIPKPQFKAFSAHEFLAHIKVLFKQEMKSKSINFSIHLDEDKLILADEQQMEQVLTNLLRNAIDAVENASNPEIHIELETKENISILVWNNGPHIADDEIDKIFIPFYTTKNEGSGVGLSICRQIVRLHGGRMLVRNADQGVIFTIRL